MTTADFAALAEGARTAAAQARSRADSITVTRVPGDPWADIYEGAAADERLHRPASRVFADHGVGYGGTG